MRPKSHRCSPPPAFGCMHALAAKQRSSLPFASGSYCSISLQKSGSAPRPWTKAVFLILVATSQLCSVQFSGDSGSASQAQICLLSRVFMCKLAPGPGLGRSHRAAWSSGSPNTPHASARVGSQNGKDGLVLFWGVCVKMGCALFSGGLIICKSRWGQWPFGWGMCRKGFVSDDLCHPRIQSALDLSKQAPTKLVVPGNFHSLQQC